MSDNNLAALPRPTDRQSIESGRSPFDVEKDGMQDGWIPAKHASFHPRLRGGLNLLPGVISFGGQGD